MDGLEDAIQDVQYVKSFTNVDNGPRPVLPWEIPSPEDLAKWKAKETAAAESFPEPFGFEWTLSHALGFFLFSAYLKSDGVGDYLGINFMEEVIRWKRAKGRSRAEKTSFIVANYLAPPTEEERAKVAAAGKAAGRVSGAAIFPATPEVPTAADGGPPPMTQIDERDMARAPMSFVDSEMEEIRASADALASYIGVGGEVLSLILKRTERLRNTPEYDMLPDIHDESGDADKSREESQHRGRSMRAMSLISNELPDSLFDAAEALVAEGVRGKHWEGFRASAFHDKLMNFLWFQDRPVVEEDFFLMRVLGRGGFGLVSACKKGTSGKLYAMKVQSKKRIKIMKDEKLVLEEKKCLSQIDSPFVINLHYSFQSPEDVILILDLMTGGDLYHHLGKRGCFNQRECLYFGARIALGLQALHDQGYVYRDLKPENCLLGEDGRVKLTDMGLATKVHSKLQGGAGTPGYWAPEMLRRDDSGKLMNYNHMVDWFSFGCCLAEFISGTNPFLSEEALNFGLEKGSETNEKAVDCATLEMHPPLDSEKFSPEASDICLRLLDKSPITRLGIEGVAEIMAHPWFKEVNWEEIESDRAPPPFVPPKYVNAASQGEIGSFEEDEEFRNTVLGEKDEEVYKNWAFTNKKAFADEVIGFLIHERETGKPLLPNEANASSSCCTIV